jgi:hypothetical protein
VDHFEQILTFRASIDDFIERIFAVASVYATKDSAIFRIRIWFFQWNGHIRILEGIILIQQMQNFESLGAIGSLKRVL